VSLGSRYNDGVIRALALGTERHTSRIAHDLNVDDGALTMELFRMAKEAGWESAVPREVRAWGG
jgi:hypothetical protein